MSVYYVETTRTFSEAQTLSILPRFMFLVMSLFCEITIKSDAFEDNKEPLVKEIVRRIVEKLRSGPQLLTGSVFAILTTF